MKLTLATTALLVFWATSPARAQTFSSGSTGADGALVCAERCIVQLPESGVLNYTTVGIGSGGTVVFRPNLRNTPVTILAQGTVLIAGAVFVDRRIDASGAATPGPGGYSGGGPSTVQNGFGPGGGNSVDPNGRWVGPFSLVPITGGSGGHGRGGVRGGAGGGAIVIASSASITVTGSISANGSYPERLFFEDAGGGSGGAIRLVTTSLSVAGFLNARAGFSGAESERHPGVIRLEAPAGSLSFTGSSEPAAILSPINPDIFPGVGTAALTILSMGGYPVSSYSGSRPNAVDLLLPSQLSDPINLVVRSRGIAPGTRVTLNISGSSSATFTGGLLSGTTDSSTATLAVSGLDRTAVTQLFVYATFDVPSSAASLNPLGEDHVARVRVETAPGQPAQYAFYRANGSEIEAKRLPPTFVNQFVP